MAGLFFGRGSVSARQRPKRDRVRHPSSDTGPLIAPPALRGYCCHHASKHRSGLDRHAARYSRICSKKGAARQEVLSRFKGGCRAALFGLPCRRRGKSTRVGHSSSIGLWGNSAVPVQRERVGLAWALPAAALMARGILCGAILLASARLGANCVIASITAP